jgi:hypothetical protein
MVVYDIYKFIHYLQSCPFEFLQNSIYQKKPGETDTNALLLDILRDISPSLLEKEQLREVHEYKNLAEEHILTLHIAAWFFSFDFFKGREELLPGIKNFLFEQLWQTRHSMDLDQ